MTSRPPDPPRMRMLPVGRFFGVPIYFAPSWLIIAAFLTVYYGPIVKDQTVGVSSGTAYLLAALYSVLFALCVLAHELGHTAASLLLGTPVRRIVIFLLGGVSEIEREADRPRDEFLISGAGPFVSVVITAILGGLFAAVDHRSMLGAVLLLLFWSNLIVAVFNLIPGLPLDGGRLLRALVWGAGASRLAGTRVAAWCGRGFAVLVALSGLLVERSTLGLASGVIAIVLAVYLWFGASQSLRVGELLDRVPAIDLRRLLRPGLLVPSDLSVAEALRRVWSGGAGGLVLVDSADRPQAIVDEGAIGAVPPERRPWTRLADVARSLEPGLILPVELHGQALLDAVQATPAREYLVVNQDGSPAGILATTDLARLLNRGAATPGPAR